MLRVIMLNVVMLSIFILSVVAPSVCMSLLPDRELTLTNNFMYCILLIIMYIQVQCAPEFQNDFWKKKYFYFSRIISKELIIASLFIIKATLTPLSYLPSIVGREYFSIIFKVKQCTLYSIKCSSSSKEIKVHLL